MKQNTKDWIQYASAIALIASAIVIAFVSFAVERMIAEGVNTYIGIALSCALAIFGVATYMVTQVASFKSEIRDELKRDRRMSHRPDEKETEEP